MATGTRLGLAIPLAIAGALSGASDLGLLPSAHLAESKTVPDHALAKSLAPGGVVGNYRDQSGPYQLLLVRCATNARAAFLLLDIKKLMTEPRYLPHMGGFAGKKEGQWFYVFAKGPFVAAVQGKPEAQADALARVFAARLPLR